jgi:glycosyltransferase involved in cell wall biosynthesis
MLSGADRPWKLTSQIQKLLSKATTPLGAKSTVRPLTTEDEAFISYISAHFDPAWYRETYPDIAAADVDPLSHWLDIGWEEGRHLGLDLLVRSGTAAEQTSSGAWQHFTWHGESFALKYGRIPEAVLDQIKAQARHDPAILAAGSEALPLLPQMESGDLLARSGIDVHSILSFMTERPEVVVMMPRLTVGGAEKYASDVVAALVNKGHTGIWVIVTEQTTVSAGDWTSRAIIAPLQSAKIIFWQDVCGPSYRNPAVLARFMNVLRPAAIMAVNSRHGLDMIVKFGRGLSQYSRLYCTYLSHDLEGLSAPFGVRFPRYTAPFATALTDNGPMEAFLRNRYGEIPGPGIAVLPPRLSAPTADTVFAERLNARAKRSIEAPRRWVWVSRIEKFKGTEILAALVNARPNDRFDLFGPLERPLNQLGLDKPSIIHRGVLEDVTNADFGSYDGFLLTNLFEGMPDIVLEMSQHAIPMILADVSGLRDTFDDTAAMFVQHTGDPHGTALSFSSALDRVASLSPQEITTMLVAARHQSLERHAPEVHASRALKLLGVK